MRPAKQRSHLRYGRTAMTTPPIRILLFEDNWEDAEVLRELLAKQSDTPVEVTHVENLADGFAYLAQHDSDVDLVLLDLNLPDSKGIETLDHVCAKIPRLPIIILTSQDNESLVMQALTRNAQDYLVKGYVQVYPNLLWRSIRYALERKRSHEEVRIAHAHTTQLLESIPSILIGLSPTRLITHWNTIAEKTFGISASQALGRSLMDCGLSWDHGRIIEALATCQLAHVPVRLEDVSFKRPDGQGFLGVTMTPIGDNAETSAGFLIFGADITERKQAQIERAKLQEQLIQAQKMEMIGQFAGGIAHDFQNFLQVILGFALTIRRRYQQPDLLRDVNEIVTAAQSGADIVRQLLTFSRKQPLEVRDVEINQAVREMVRMLEHFLGKHVTVHLRLAPLPMVVKLDPTGLKQIIMNLMSNARDAMPKGGELTISTQRVQLLPDFVKDHSWARMGDFVRLSIRDTGTGMDPLTAKRLFEPFYTTKQVGSGTGLGMSVVYGLMQQHQGLIDVETALGQGTTFHLYLPTQAPVAQPPAEADDPTEAKDLVRLPSPAVAAPTNGHGDRPRVLIVDDNSSILMLCEHILEDNYQVTTTSSGFSALDMLQQQPYDLLLTDLQMPLMDGVTLLGEATKLRPSLHILAMTGSVDTEERLRRAAFTCELLRKPFTPTMLEDAIKQAL